MVHLELAAETANAVLQHVGIGCGLFDDRAFAVANAAGLPKPILDADDEKRMWWHNVFIGDGPATTSTAPEADGTARRLSVDIPVDSKAMRKWDENQTFAWVVQNDNIDGTATEVDVGIFGRMLLKLN